MVTVEINERTKAGKIILELVELFSKDKKGVKIIEPEKKSEKKEKIPNAETLRSMEKTSKNIGLTKCKDIDDLFQKLEI